MPMSHEPHSGNEKRSAERKRARERKEPEPAFGLASFPDLTKIDGDWEKILIIVLWAIGLAVSVGVMLWMFVVTMNNL